MSQAPSHTPLQQHFDTPGAKDDSRPLPPGWLREWDSGKNIPFFVNTNVDPPHSQWTNPLDDSRAEQEHVYGEKLPDHHFAPPSSEAPHAQTPPDDHRAIPSVPQNTPQTTSHGPDWLKLGGAGLGGAAVGALLDHEWEKHKQTEAYKTGLAKGQSEAQLREAALKEKLAHLEAQNHQLAAQNVQNQQIAAENLQQQQLAQQQAQYALQHQPIANVVPMPVPSQTGYAPAYGYAVPQTAYGAVQPAYGGVQPVSGGYGYGVEGNLGAYEAERERERMREREGLELVGILGGLERRHERMEERREFRREAWGHRMGEGHHHGRW